MLPGLFFTRKALQICPRLPGKQGSACLPILAEYRTPIYLRRVFLMRYFQWAAPAALMSAFALSACAGGGSSPNPVAPGAGSAAEARHASPQLYADSTGARFDVACHKNILAATRFPSPAAWWSTGAPGMEAIRARKPEPTPGPETSAGRGPRVRARQLKPSRGNGPGRSRARLR